MYVLKDIIYTSIQDTKKCEVHNKVKDKRLHILWVILKRSATKYKWVERVGLLTQNSELHPCQLHTRIWSSIISSLHLAISWRNLLSQSLCTLQLHTNFELGFCVSNPWERPVCVCVYMRALCSSGHSAKWRALSCAFYKKNRIFTETVHPQPPDFVHGQTNYDS